MGVVSRLIIPMVSVCFQEIWSWVMDPAIMQLDLQFGKLSELSKKLKFAEMILITVIL